MRRRVPIAAPGVAACGLLVALLLAAAGAAAGSRVPGDGETAGGLAAIAARLRAVPPLGPALAAEATDDGHWRFLSLAGETYTAGTPEELARVAPILFPDAPRAAELALYVAPDTIFGHRLALAALPPGSTLYLMAGGLSYPVTPRADGEGKRWFAQVRPNLMLELAERAAFAEAAWQLARPLATAAIRILALEPGGPPTLPSTPRLEPESGRALVDAIDPRSLTAALARVRGQTVLVTAHIAGGVLNVQPARGPEASLALAPLFAAAEEADVNLIVLHAASVPRQPGGRNWLWQKVEVAGLHAALGNATLADFFDALGAANRPLLVAATTAPGRASLTMLPGAGAPAPALDVEGMYGGVLAQITGRVSIAGVAASLRSAERERELARRIIPGVPAALQAAYAVLLLLGGIGSGAARAWWRRLWPPERITEYAGRAGYRAARAVRGLVFLLLFVPLSAPASLPCALARGLMRARGAAARVREARPRRRLPAGP